MTPFMVGLDSHMTQLKSQLGFINFVVAPYYDVLSQGLGWATPHLHLRANHDMYTNEIHLLENGEKTRYPPTDLHPELSDADKRARGLPVFDKDSKNMLMDEEKTLEKQRQKEQGGESPPPRSEGEGSGGTSVGKGDAEVSTSVEVEEERLVD